MNLFEHVKKYYSVYPSILGYHYLDQVTPELLKDLENSEFVFIASDFHDLIPDCHPIQVMTSAQHLESVMWLQEDFSNFKQMPPSEWTEVPSVGFVGRLPMILSNDNKVRLHNGFKPRYDAIFEITKSDNICLDFHIHHHPDGDSAGFWNHTRPDYKKNGPLFKNNMLANQYQLCARGNANWSLRFYEALAYGRIPVFIESGGKWPIFGGSTNDFEESVDGFPFPVIYDIADIESELLEFHAAYGSSAEIAAAQWNCRKFYDDWFSQTAQIVEFDFRFEEFKGPGE